MSAIQKYWRSWRVAGAKHEIGANCVIITLSPLNATATTMAISTAARSPSGKQLETLKGQCNRT